MKQRREFTGVRVYAGKICSFVAVTGGTGKSHVLLQSQALVELADNVIGVERNELKHLLCPALFAAVAGAVADPICQPVWNPVSHARPRWRRAP